jgi:transcription initiation factor IIE alpha subunit
MILRLKNEEESLRLVKLSQGRRVVMEEYKIWECPVCDGVLSEKDNFFRCSKCGQLVSEYDVKKFCQEETMFSGIGIS